MAFTRTLKRQSPMMRGDDVEEMQKRLLALGHTVVGEPDGVFGDDTESGVKAFQTDNGLPVTGTVDRTVWDALFVETDTQPAAASAALGGLTENHNFNGGVNWRLDTAGIRIDDAAPEDTGGAPQTVARVMRDFGASIEKWAQHFDVPLELIVATICTETRGNASAVRTEPGYISDEETPHRVSPGLMQTLISTARDTLGDDTIDRAWLLQPDNAIRAGTAYIARQKSQTRFDPPKVACAYNAGGIYANDGAENRWKMRQYPIGTGEHADRFVRWFNDCFRYFTQEGSAPSPTLYEQINDA